MPYTPSSNLTISIEKPHLKALLELAKDNFFYFLYNKTKLYYYKRNKKHLFGFCYIKEYILMDREEAYITYTKEGFQSTLRKLDDTYYQDLFTNYDIILNIDSSNVAEVHLKDFKILLDISDISIQHFKDDIQNDK